ncbi:MAG: B12-binding domain-containing protein [Promethearchaeota archaeon]
MSEELINAMVKLEDDLVLKLVKEQLKKRDPLDIFEDLKDSLIKIGDLFESEEYFLSDLIIAADTFKEASKVIEPYFSKEQDEIKGKVIIGTVEGDMHDIGKNIIITLLRSEGFEVIDLGIDVSAKEFLEAVKKTQPNIVGLSGLLTSSKEPMKKTIELIKNEYKDTEKLIFIVGGVAINEEWIKDTGADYGTTNAINGLKIINDVIKNF